MLSDDSALTATTSRFCECPSTTPYGFCKKPGHCENICYTRKRAKDSHKALRQKVKDKNANKAQEISFTMFTVTSTPSTFSPVTASANAGSIILTESAGDASLHFSNPSDSFCPLQLNADVDWNAETDTGCTIIHLYACQSHWQTIPLSILLRLGL